MRQAPALMTGPSLRRGEKYLAVPVVLMDWCIQEGIAKIYEGWVRKRK